MRGKNSQKTARLLALHHAIESGTFNPDSVSYTDLAAALGVSRGTIMRDLQEMESFVKESRKLQTVLRNATLTETHRHN